MTGDDKGMALMPRRSICAWFLATVLAVFAMSAGSDVIVMKNGDRITGDIKKLGDDELFIEPAYGDEFAVDLDAIASIASDREFEIELHDHIKIVGVSTTDAEGSPVSVTAGEMRPPPVTEELDEPEDYLDWKVSSDLAANVSRGNSDNTNWRLQSYGMVKAGDHRHTLEITLERQEKNGETTKEQDDVVYGYNWLLSDDWSLVGSLSWRRDPQRDLETRWISGGGLGYQIWDDTNRSFRVSLTADAIFEEIGGQKDESFAPRWSLRFSHDLLGGDVAFFHNHDIWTYVAGRNNNVFEITTGFRYEITDLIYANLRVDFNYETDPASGADNEDVTYLMGIGVELD